MSTAAAEGADRIARLRSRFRPKAWTDFSSRLSDHSERLFRLLHQLYGWRYDFAWIYEKVLETAAHGAMERSKALRKADRKAAVPPQWLSDSRSLLGMAYLDRYAGSAKGLRDRFQHLDSLGVTHLHLLPPYATPDRDNDGGFAVSDYRRLRTGLGKIKDLAKVAADLREIGVTLVLDMVLSGTASDHKWAQAAAAGESDYERFYYFFPDRAVPDSYATYLRPAGPERGGDAFTWHQDVEGGAWVWTTSSDSQWDLNYANPNVLAAVIAEMLFLANLGAGVIRINGESLLWKQPGTDCENLPEAHVIVQVLDTIIRIAAPSVSLISGAMVPAADDFVRPGECRAGYNSVLMSAVWECLASTDTRLLAQVLGSSSPAPPGCARITYLRSHDEIGWWFSDDAALALGVDPESHRRFLNAFYSGNWDPPTARGRITSYGIAGTAAALTGLEAAVESLDADAAEVAVRKLLAAFSVILGAPGIPMLFLGDETAHLSDHSHVANSGRSGDLLWRQRPAFDGVRFQGASAGEGPEGSMLAGLRHLLAVRRDISEFGPSLLPEPFDVGDSGLLGFRRGSTTIVVNMSGRPVIVDRSNLPAGELFDLVANDIWDGHILGPYEYRYLQVSR